MTDVNRMGVAGSASLYSTHTPIAAECRSRIAIVQSMSAVN